MIMAGQNLLKDYESMSNCIKLDLDAMIYYGRDLKHWRKFNGVSRIKYFLTMCMLMENIKIDYLMEEKI